MYACILTNSITTLQRVKFVCIYTFGKQTVLHLGNTTVYAMTNNTNTESRNCVIFKLMQLRKSISQMIMVLSEPDLGHLSCHHFDWMVRSIRASNQNISKISFQDQVVCQCKRTFIISCLQEKLS